MRGAEEIFLEVDEGNLAALRLYAKLGFAKVGERKAYYEGDGGRSTALTGRTRRVRTPPSRAEPSIPSSTCLGATPRPTPRGAAPGYRLNTNGSMRPVVGWSVPRSRGGASWSPAASTG